MLGINTVPYMPYLIKVILFTGLSAQNSGAAARPPRSVTRSCRQQEWGWSARIRTLVAYLISNPGLRFRLPCFLPSMMPVPSWSKKRLKSSPDSSIVGQKLRYWYYLPYTTLFNGVKSRASCDLSVLYPGLTYHTVP